MSHLAGVMEQTVQSWSRMPRR